MSEGDGGTACIKLTGEGWGGQAGLESIPVFQSQQKSALKRHYSTSESASSVAADMTSGGQSQREDLARLSNNISR